MAGCIGAEAWIGSATGDAVAEALINPSTADARFAFVIVCPYLPICAIDTVRSQSIIAVSSACLTGTRLLATVCEWTAYVLDEAHVALAPLVLSTSCYFVILALFSDLVACILGWRGYARYVTLQHGLAGADVRSSIHTSPGVAFAVLEITAFGHALFAPVTEAFIDGSITGRFTSPILLEVPFHNPAILHGLKKFHLSLKEEEALIVHCLRDLRAIGAAIHTETLCIDLPEGASAIFDAPLSELLTCESGLDLQGIFAAAVGVAYLYSSIRGI